MRSHTSPKPSPGGAPVSARVPGSERNGALLGTGTTEEVLARIVPEDALELRPRIARRLGELALLCDADRVLLTAQALCALEAGSWRGEPELASWLDERVEEALATVLSEDAVAPERRLTGSLQALATHLALDGRSLSAACARFNRLPREQREAFFALVLDASRVDLLARARALSLSELARRARAGLEPFLHASPLSPTASAS